MSILKKRKRTIGVKFPMTRPLAQIREELKQTVPIRQPDGEFRNFQTWVNKASSWIGGTNSICADAMGRICRNGKDFLRARDEGAFPVRFWLKPESQKLLVEPGDGPVQPLPGDQREPMFL